MYGLEYEAPGMGYSWRLLAELGTLEQIWPLVKQMAYGPEYGVQGWWSHVFIFIFHIVFISAKICCACGVYR